MRRRLLVAAPESAAAPPVRIGVARDEAFCFYYEGNLALLVALGAELVPFSPIRDAFPRDVDGLYFGGGFPELFVEELSQNQNMLRGVKNKGQLKGQLVATLKQRAQAGGAAAAPGAVRALLQDLKGVRWEALSQPERVQAQGDRLAVAAASGQTFC